VKAGLKFEFKADFAFRQTMAMVMSGVLQERAEAIQRLVTHTAATVMLEEVQSKIPKGADYETYRSSLRLVQSGVINPVFAVAAEAKRGQDVKPDRDVIYFKPTNPRRGVSPGVQILMRYQPWAVDAVPYDPPANEAKRYFRRVSKFEVEGTRRRNAEKRKEWEAAFTKAGVKFSPLKPDPKIKASPDLSYTALRLEYGLGGSRSVAHWRPAIVATRQRVAALFTSEVVGRAMLDWTFDGWKTWRNLSATPVPATTVETFTAFQDKIR
jgi:hypothetical protein